MRVHTMAALAAGLDHGERACADMWGRVRSRRITVDSVARTVTIALEVTICGGALAYSTAFGEGAAQVVVPLGWTVAGLAQRRFSTAPHSLVVMQERKSCRPKAGVRCSPMP